MMKKTIATVIILLIMSCFMLPVFAESPAVISSYEQAVLDQMNVGITVTGGTYYAPQAYIIQAENYLRTVDLTLDQANSAISAINQSITVINNSGLYTDGAPILDLTLLTLADKTNLLNIAKNTAGPMNLTLYYIGADSNLSITDSNQAAIFNDKVAKVLTLGTTPAPTSNATQAPSASSSAAATATVKPSTSAAASATIAPSPTPAKPASTTPTKNNTLAIILIGGGAAAGIGIVGTVLFNVFKKR